MLSNEHLFKIFYVTLYTAGRAACADRELSRYVPTITYPYSEADARAYPGAATTAVRLVAGWPSVSWASGG